MSEQAKPTPGRWAVYDNKPYVQVEVADGATKTLVAHIAGPECKDLWPFNKERWLADARLIAEAGTVHHETGLTPRQLAEQRAELLGALESIRHSMKQAAVPGNDWRREIKLSEQIAEAAIAKTRGGSDAL